MEAGNLLDIKDIKVTNHFGVTKEGYYSFAGAATYPKGQLPNL